MDPSFKRRPALQSSMKRRGVHYDSILLLRSSWTCDSEGLIEVPDIIGNAKHNFRWLLIKAGFQAPARENLFQIRQ